MINKKIKLTLLSLIAIAIIFSIPFNNQWLNTKIFNDHFTISDQAEHMGIEERKEYRYGGNYLVHQAIVKTISDNMDINKAIILLPPADYIREGKISGYDPVEPIIFYYFTGIKGVIWNSPDVRKANWAFVSDNKQMYLKKIEDTVYLNSLINIYKKYVR